MSDISLDDLPSHTQDSPPPSSPSDPEHLGLDREIFSDGRPYLVAVPGERAPRLSLGRRGILMIGGGCKGTEKSGLVSTDAEKVQLL